MSLNIMNPECHRLARELTTLTGERVTEAVTTALHERLVRLKRQRHPPLANRLVQIGQDCAVQLNESFRFVDHAELLYDEKGLPRRSSTPRDHRHLDG